MKCFSLLFLAINLCVYSQEKIGVQTLEFYDETRFRPVNVELWYPIEQNDEEEENILDSVWILPKEVRKAAISQKQTSYPLIVMSHGNWGDRRDRMWFAEVLVRQGYIVASVEHFGNTWQSNHSDFFLSPWDRPLDISFVLDQLLSGTQVSSWINPEKIGFSGYSLGGMTGIWLAGARLKNLEEDAMNIFDADFPLFLIEEVLKQFDFDESTHSFYDPRIQAFFVLSPSAWGFNAETFQNIHSPIHIVALEQDTVLPVDANAYFLANQIKTAHLSLIEGNVDHYVFLNRVSEYGMQKLPEWLYEEDLSGERQKVHEQVAKLAIQFYEKNL